MTLQKLLIFKKENLLKHLKKKKNVTPKIIDIQKGNLNLQKKIIMKIKKKIIIFKIKKK